MNYELRPISKSVICITDGVAELLTPVGVMGFQILPFMERNNVCLDCGVIIHGRIWNHVYKSKQHNLNTYPRPKEEGLLSRSHSTEWSACTLHGSCIPRCTTTTWAVLIWAPSDTKQILLCHDPQQASASASVKGEHAVKGLKDSPHTELMFQPIPRVLRKQLKASVIWLVLCICTLNFYRSTLSPFLTCINCI